MKKENAKRNGYIGLGAMVILAGIVAFGSDSFYKSIDSLGKPVLYTSGNYIGSARGFGGPVTAEVLVSAKSIEFISVKGEEETLLDLVLPGLTDQILAKQSPDVDAVSGATLSSEAIKAAVSQALAKAKGEAAEEIQPETEGTGETLREPPSWKDGSYAYEAPEFDDKGYKDQISLTIKDSIITSLIWDCVKEDGSQKSQLSMDGKYVMTENGPKWHEQAIEVANYVLDHQSM